MKNKENSIILVDEVLMKHKYFNANVSHKYIDERLQIKQAYI